MERGAEQVVYYSARDLQKGGSAYCYFAAE